MTITTTRDVIQIGDSLGVTLPAKELRRAGIKPGDSLRIKVELIEPAAQPDIMADYAAFKAQYGQTLKNLSGR